MNCEHMGEQRFAFEVDFARVAPPSLPVVSDPQMPGQSVARNERFRARVTFESLHFQMHTEQVRLCVKFASQFSAALVALKQPHVPVNSEQVRPHAGLPYKSGCATIALEVPFTPVDGGDMPFQVSGSAE